MSSSGRRSRELTILGVEVYHRYEDGIWLDRVIVVTVPWLELTFTRPRRISWYWHVSGWGKGADIYTPLLNIEMMWGYQSNNTPEVYYVGDATEAGWERRKYYQ